MARSATLKIAGVTLAGPISGRADVVRLCGSISRGALLEFNLSASGIGGSCGIAELAAAGALP